GRFHEMEMIATANVMRMRRGKRQYRRVCQQIEWRGVVRITSMVATVGREGCQHLGCKSTLGDRLSKNLGRVTVYSWSGDDGAVGSRETEDEKRTRECAPIYVSKCKTRNTAEAAGPYSIAGFALLAFAKNVHN
ncbi:hypothetical protein ALC57_08461, partial [Trachymyrmex cornetzi]